MSTVAMRPYVVKRPGLVSEEGGEGGSVGLAKAARVTRPSSASVLISGSYHASSCMRMRACVCACECVYLGARCNN